MNKNLIISDFAREAKIVKYLPYSLNTPVEGKYGIISNDQKRYLVIFSDNNIVYDLECFPLNSYIDLSTGMTANDFQLLEIEEISEEEAQMRNAEFNKALKLYQEDLDIPVILETK